MAQINKRIVFIKDNNQAVAGTLTLTEISGKIYIKLSAGGSENYIVALEGDILPITLFKAKDIKREHLTEITTALGDNISVILLYKKMSEYIIHAYGSIGKTPVSKQTLMEKAKKRLIGENIVEPQSESYNDSAKTKKQEEEIEKNNDVKNDYESSYEIIKADIYMAEDTTLKDIDLIAEENYYDLYNKDLLSEVKNNKNEIITAENEDVDFQVLKGDEAEYGEQNESDNTYLADNTEKGIESLTEGESGKITGVNYGEGCYYDQTFDLLNGFEDCLSYPEDYSENYRNEYSNNNNLNGGGDYQEMDYYNKVKERLSILLAENEKDNCLIGIIPESDFVKVFYANDKFYSVGLIKTDGMPSYICYGVPAMYSENPPEEFRGMGKWMPVDVENPKGEGYYVIFQNCYNGEYIKY